MQWVRSCVPQTRCVQLGEEKNQFPIPEIRPRVLRRPASSLVTIVTELPPIPTWSHKWRAVGIWWGTLSKALFRVCRRSWYLMVLTVCTGSIKNPSICRADSVGVIRCRHATTQLQLNGFSWNFIFENFLKICRNNSNFVEIWQESRAPYMKTCINLCYYLASICL